MSLNQTKILLTMLMLLAQVGCSRDEKALQARIVKPGGRVDSKVKANEKTTGEAGKITVTGPGALMTENNVSKVNAQIKINRTSGNGCVSGALSEESDPSVAAINAKLSDDEVNNLAIAEKSTEYINIGCADLKATDVQGLTEKKLDANQQQLKILRAHKVFVCGALTEKVLDNQMLLFTADDLILGAVTQNMDQVQGQISLKANNLYLVGANKISTKAGSKAGVSISVTIAKGIHSKGTLEISTQGGDCVKSAAPQKEKEESDKDSEGSADLV